MILLGVGFRGPAPAPHLPAAGHRHRGLRRILHLGGAHHQERSQIPTILIVLRRNCFFIQLVCLQNSHKLHLLMSYLLPTERMCSI